MLKKQPARSILRPTALLLVVAMSVAMSVARPAP